MKEENKLEENFSNLADERRNDLHSAKDDYLRVGVIVRTHGVRGEVKVFPTTDDSKRFKKLKKALIKKDADELEIHIEAVRFFKDMVILKIKEFNNMDEAEKYKGFDILVDRANAVPLLENEYFICDIIGAEVFTEDGEKFGVLRDVITTGANDVYEVIRENGKSILLPVIDECVLSIDVENKKVIIRLMDGLLEAYE